MKTTYDKWAYSRLLGGHTLNGELDLITEPWRGLAEHLASLPPGRDRKIAFDGFLATHEDRDKLRKDLADADPLAPAPAIEPDEDEWAPVKFGLDPPVEAFPLDVLPGPARRLAEVAARSIACPVDFPAVATLAAASGLIGRSASLLVKPGYFASASLYVSLVGTPSSGKSPALRAALAPLGRVSHDLHAKWRPEMDQWARSDPKIRGKPPILRRVVTSDPTTEALGPILANNPRGLIVTPDEMTKWVMSMDQYRGGKGWDRQFYMSTWNGDLVITDRAKHMQEPIVVPHPFLTVAGGMVPDMLSSLAEGKGRDDGFLARLLFSYPDRVVRWYSEEGVPDSVAEDWAELSLALWHRDMLDADGRPTPHVVMMTPDAHREWVEWARTHYAEQERDDFADSLEGPWGKLEIYLPRLALILHLMHLAADPARSSGDDILGLPRRAIEGAAHLVAYFKSHTRRVYWTIGGRDSPGDDVAALLRWIIRNGLAEFSLRDVHRNFSRFKDDPETLEDAIVWLSERHIVRHHEDLDAPKGPGRKKTPTYKVNPALRYLAKTPRFRRYS